MSSAKGEFFKNSDFLSRNPEAVERIREFVSDAAAKKFRDEILATPEGVRLSEAIHSAFQDELNKVDNTYRQAIDELGTLIETNGADAEAVQQLKQTFAAPEEYSHQKAQECIERLRETLPADSVSAGPSAAQVIKSGSSTQAQTVVANMDRARNASDRIISREEGRDIIERATTHPVNPETEIEIPEESTNSSVVPTPSSGNLPIDHSTSIIQYLNNGDTSEMNADNMTEADYTVLSKLSYVNAFSRDRDYRIACEQEGRNLTVKQYCDNLLRHSDVLSEDNIRFLQSVSANPRYGNLIMDHSDTMNVGEIETQIISVRTGDDHAIIAVQGTNGMVADWIIDGDFASDELTREEEWVKDKIYSYMAEYDSIDLTGHSQGGREAISTAAFCPDEYRGKIRRIVSLDGPGYSPEFMEKYGHLFGDTAEKTTHVFPKDSIVGQLLEFPGGRIVCVYATDKLIHNHNLGTWVIYDDGTYRKIDESELGRLSKIVRPFTGYACKYLSVEERQQILPTVFRLFSEPGDPGKLEFENIFGNLDHISFGDGLDMLAGFGVLVGEAFLDFYDQAEPYLQIAEDVMLVLSLIPWPGAPYCKAIHTFLSNIDTILESVAKVCEVISTIAHFYLEYKARKQEEERRSYLAQNPQIEMNYLYLQMAKEHLENANAALSRADTAGDGLWQCFEQDDVKETETILDDIVKVVFEIVTYALSVFDAKRFLQRTAGFVIDLGYLQESANVTKGIDVIDRVIESSKNISIIAQSSENEISYTVLPSMLAQRAEKAREYVKDIHKLIENAQLAIEKTGNLWIADDYDSINELAKENISEILGIVEDIRNTYGTIEDIATAYQSLQSYSVREFQAAAN